MPRHSRIKSDSNIYHIMSRALNKQLLFDEEIDYLRFLQILSIVKKEFKLRVYAYCLMSNHVHLIVRDTNAELSNAMKQLNSRYAMYYNKKNTRVGYVFSDRFKSEAIESKDYLLNCIRYIHQNPVKANICSKVNQYKFSSIHAYKRDKGNFLNIVDAKPVLKLIDKDEFLKWNDEMCEGKFMDVIANKLSDTEVIDELLKITKAKRINEFRNLDEPIKMLAVLKMIDKGVPMMQLSRITGIYYSKIQKMKKGQEGKVIGLTYYK